MFTTDLYRVASRFLGLREAAGTVHNDQIMAMLHLDNHWPSGDEVPWCSAFVNYVAWLLNLPRSKSLAARSWLSIGMPVAAAASASRGFDIVVFRRGDNPASGHVAIFDRLEGDRVWVLGGNQGDAVSIASFPLADVIGIRRLVT